MCASRRHIQKYPRIQRNQPPSPRSSFFPDGNYKPSGVGMEGPGGDVDEADDKWMATNASGALAVPTGVGRQTQDPLLAANNVVVSVLKS